MTPIINSIGMEFVQVQPGTFQMGDNEASKPIHQVTISKSFYIGKYLVTQSQWQAIIGKNPSNFKGLNRPVETVSWLDAHKYIDALNEKENSNKYRLPTEAEWEFAARGGVNTRGMNFAGSNILEEVAVYEGNSEKETKSVGSKQPNELGIFDMTGNVWEWCDDWLSSYSSEPEIDPNTSLFNPFRNNFKILRGGAYKQTLQGDCRVTFRFFNNIDCQASDVGFRVVKDSER